MVNEGTLAPLEGLPHEVLLQILSFLDPLDVVHLQSVSQAMHKIARDNEFWRAQCFDRSAFLATLRRRRRYFRDARKEEPKACRSSQAQYNQRLRFLANWDPVYPGEKVSWYDEYIHRSAPIVVNWFQRPVPLSSSPSSPANQILPHQHMDVSGLALYRPDTGHDGADYTSQPLFAVAALDDGSVCLWDVHGTHSRQGAVVAQSKPGILLAASTRAAMMPQDFVSECVSVDGYQHLAYFSISNLNLQTLEVVRTKAFRSPITALSTAYPAIPLTIGTQNNLHLHDSRDPAMAMAAEHPKPGPLSILHLPLQSSGKWEDMLSNDIYTAGSIPSILHYDRRHMATPRDSIHSGGRLSSLTALPFQTSPLHTQQRQDAGMSLRQVEEYKQNAGGCTVVAGGAYKTKGSLELYSTGPSSSRNPMNMLQNRQTSSSCKILSVATHGKRIVFSGGRGMVRWFERDGVTEVRSCPIDGDDSGNDSSGLFGNGNDTSQDSQSQHSQNNVEMARKILPTRVAEATQTTGSDNASHTKGGDLVFWTGEKLGLLGFSSKPGTRADDFVEQMETEEERVTAQQHRSYSARMRQLLEKQANDVRYVGHLGFGVDRRF